MNLKIVTVVYGDEFKRIAEITLPRAEQVLGQSVKVYEGTDWADVKLWDMWDDIDGPTLCIDADLVFRSWDWDPWNPEKFNAVLDEPYMSWTSVMRKMQPFLDTTRLVNGGLWMATPDHRLVFEQAYMHKEEMPVLPFDPLGDQYFLNKALQEREVDVNHIPASMNFQVKSAPRWQLPKIPDDVHVIHLVNPDKKLLRVQAVAEAYGVKG